MYLKNGILFIDQVLLELTDTELESGLSLNHAMHRKKIRLAIEERRTGNMVRYPLLSTIGNRWVINEWLTDIGLEQVCLLFIEFIFTFGSKLNPFLFLVVCR